MSWAFLHLLPLWLLLVLALLLAEVLKLLSSVDVVLADVGPTKRIKVIKCVKSLVWA